MCLFTHAANSRRLSLSDVFTIVGDSPDGLRVEVENTDSGLLVVLTQNALLSPLDLLNYFSISCFIILAEIHLDIFI